jgi:hypothetical protein
LGIFSSLLFFVFFSFHSPKEPNERENVGNETQKQKKKAFPLAIKAACFVENDS